MSKQLFIISHLDFAENKNKDNNINKHSTPFETIDGIYTDLNTASEVLEEIYFNILELNTDDDGKEDHAVFRRQDINTKYVFSILLMTNM